jgi:hypothetical protein
MTYEGAHGSIGPLLSDLGASVTAVAVISGLGEMIGASLRFFSGRLADRTRAYWTLAIAGYVLNVVAIPALAVRHDVAAGGAAHHHRADRKGVTWTGARFVVVGGNRQGWSRLRLRRACGAWIRPVRARAAC